jgi:hypothetical protein
MGSTAFLYAAGIILQLLSVGIFSYYAYDAYVYDFQLGNRWNDGSTPGSCFIHENSIIGGTCDTDIFCYAGIITVTYSNDNGTEYNNTVTIFDNESNLSKLNEKMLDYERNFTIPCYYTINNPQEVRVNLFSTSLGFFIMYLIFILMFVMTITLSFVFIVGYMCAR